MMNKFTNNAYNFVNGCIGNNSNFRVTISGDFDFKDGLVAGLYYCDELKNMIITNIEIQWNKLYLIVKKEIK